LGEVGVLRDFVSEFGKSIEVMARGELINCLLQVKVCLLTIILSFDVAAIAFKCKPIPGRSDENLLLAGLLATKRFSFEVFGLTEGFEIGELSSNFL